MSELSITQLIQARLKGLDEAIKAYQKDKNDIARDAVILRLQRAISDVLALMHATVSEEEECECESIEELLASLKESEAISDNEEEALMDIINAVEALSDTSDEETIDEIMGYAPIYHKALSIFAQKFSIDEE